MNDVDVFQEALVELAARKVNLLVASSMQVP
jgi:hypothetical protein